MSQTEAATSTKQVVEAAYAAMTSGDGEAFAALLADDVKLTEPDHHPTPGTWTSKADLLEAFPSIAGGLGLRGVTVHHLVVDGDRAVGLIDIACTSQSGTEHTVAAAETWLVEDGLVKEIRPYYWDTAALVAAQEA